MICTQLLDSYMSPLVARPFTAVMQTVESIVDCSGKDARRANSPDSRSPVVMQGQAKFTNDPNVTLESGMIQTCAAIVFSHPEKNNAAIFHVDTYSRDVSKTIRRIVDEFKKSGSGVNDITVTIVGGINPRINDKLLGAAVLLTKVAVPTAISYFCGFGSLITGCIGGAAYCSDQAGSTAMDISAILSNVRCQLPMYNFKSIIDRDEHTSSRVADDKTFVVSIHCGSGRVQILRDVSDCGISLGVQAAFSRDASEEEQARNDAHFTAWSRNCCAFPHLTASTFYRMQDKKALKVT